MTVPDAAGLQASFPCQPQRQSRAVRLPGVPASVPLTLLVCQDDGESWSLAYATLSDVREVPAALSGLQTTLASNVAAAAAMVSPDLQPRALAADKVAVPRATPMAGTAAQTWLTQRADGLGRPTTMRVDAWHFAHGLQVFQAVAWQTTSQSDAKPGEDRAAPFLRGFQFPD